jgi:hypothetical protein
LNKNQRKKAHRRARKMSASSASSSSDIDFLLAPSCCAPSHSGSLEPHSLAHAQLEALRSYLAPPSDLPSNINPADWHELISTLFRYVILRTSTLAPLALTSTLGSVETFLDLLEQRMETRCGDEIEKLWKAMKFEVVGPIVGPRNRKKMDTSPSLLGVGVVGDAIVDVFRARAGGESASGTSVSLLGGKVYKEPCTMDLPPAGWDLFYQFVSTGEAGGYFCTMTPPYQSLDCVDCVRRLCSRLDPDIRIVHPKSKARRLGGVPCVAHTDGATSRTYFPHGFHLAERQQHANSRFESEASGAEGRQQQARQEQENGVYRGMGATLDLYPSRESIA